MTCCMLLLYKMTTKLVRWLQTLPTNLHKVENLQLKYDGLILMTNEPVNVKTV